MVSALWVHLHFFFLFIRYFYPMALLRGPKVEPPCRPRDLNQQPSDWFKVLYCHELFSVIVSTTPEPTDSHAAATLYLFSLYSFFGWLSEQHTDTGDLKTHTCAPPLTILPISASPGTKLPACLAHWWCKLARNHKASTMRRVSGSHWHQQQLEKSSLIRAEHE